MTVTFNVIPSEADWYYCATIAGSYETTYIDGYTVGDKPTLAEFQAHSACDHVWVAGMCYVSDEDVESMATTRRVECEKCESTYAERDMPRFRGAFRVLEWEVKATPHGAHSDEWAPETEES